MKIATWNVNSVRARMSHIQSWLNTHCPDILAIQETKVIDDDFPEEEVKGWGYVPYYSGQKSYNGVAILTKTACEGISTTFSGYDETQKRYIGATIGGIRILNIYVPNGKDINTEQHEYKLNWLCSFSQHVVHELNQHERVAVLGDFNIAPSDIDVFDPDYCAGQILCSDSERFALEELMGADLVDVFRHLDPEKKTFSWWDYRGGAFRRNRGLRIDLILATQNLATSCSYCEIDREPRMLEKPSDHAPVVANFRD